MHFRFIVIISVIIILSLTNFTWAQESPKAKEEEIFTEEPGFEAPPEPRPTKAVQLELPDISVIGDIRGKLSTDKSDFAANNILINEVELALQSYLYPDIRGDVFLAMHRHERHIEPEICEVYINFLKLSKDLSLKAGKIHVGFGKVNPIHQHHRPYVDQPTAITNFFGPHGLVAEGAVLSYLLPTATFAQVDLATWQVAEPHENNHSHQNHLGLTDRVNTARWWSSFPVAENTELETGLNVANGVKASVYGLDLTYKRWPSAYERLILQGEYLWTSTARSGFYIFSGWRKDKYWEYGLRYDRADYVEPAEGSEASVSAIATNHLTETTKVRFQYKYTSGKSQVHEAFLQVIFGMGPHAHPLQ